MLAVVLVFEVVGLVAAVEGAVVAPVVAVVTTGATGATMASGVPEVTVVVVVVEEPTAVRLSVLGRRAMNPAVVTARMMTSARRVFFMSFVFLE